MPRKVNSPAVSLRGHIQPVSRGGTGVEKITDAADKLGFVKTSAKNAPNGYAALDATGKIPATSFNSIPGVNQVNLEGKFRTTIDVVSTFTISDFDSFRNYEVSVSAGSVSRNGEVLTFTAPSAPQAVVLNINGRSIEIVVGAVAPQTPSITSPVANATNLPVGGVSFTGSAFSISNAETHASSDWQVATDVGFTNIVSQSVANATDKTSWKSGTLEISKDYYARVRYCSSSGTYSEYSAPIKFTTSSIYFSGVEEAILTAADKAAGAQFGTSVAISGDGTRVVVGSPGIKSGSDNGKVYIFLKSGGTWTLEKTFDSGNFPPQGYIGNFGKAVALSPDGTYLAVGNPQYSYTTDTGNAVYPGLVSIFIRSGSTWNYIRSISPVSGTAMALFGNSLAFNSDATLLLIGAPSDNNYGAAYVYSRATGSTAFQLLTTLRNNSSNQPVGGENFGLSVAISADGSRILIGAPFRSSNGGIGFIFARSGNVWNLEAMTPGTTSSGANGRMGLGLAINSDGTKAVLSDPYTNGGVVNVYSRNGTTWTGRTITPDASLGTTPTFGISLAMSADGTKLFIGANTANGKGSVEIYEVDASNAWRRTGSMVSSNLAGADNFGTSLALSNDTSRVIAGATLADPGGTSAAGSAYIFR